MEGSGLIISKFWRIISAALCHHVCRERENTSSVPDPLGCGCTTRPQLSWTCGLSMMSCTVPTQPPWLQPWKGQFPPKGGKAVPGNSLLEHLPHFPTPVSQPAACPSGGSWDQAPAVSLWLITTCSLHPLPHLPLYPCPLSHCTNGLFGALPGFLGIR